MNVASLELCEQLYELSDWVDTSYIWHVPKWRDGNKIHEDHNAAYIVFAGPDGHDDGRKPAYDLGYLLDKLPNNTSINKLESNIFSASTLILGKFEDIEPSAEADTASNATAKLAIALFKQGVLHKEGEHEQV